MNTSIIKATVKSKILAFILLIPLSWASAQQRNQEATILAYNVGFGGLTAGIGAVINKPKGASIPKVFLKGFYQGCFGGALQYSGKKLTHLIVSQDSYWYAWPARISHSAGASIVESAALNRPFGKYWNMDMGPLRFDWAVGEKKEFRTRFNAWIIYDVITGFQKGSIDWSKTLQTGCLTYSSNDWISTNPFNVGGEAYTRSLTYSKETSIVYGSKRKRELFAHEIIHIFQYREYLIFNSWIAPITSNIFSKNDNIFQKYVFVELPYIRGFYLSEGQHDAVNYYKNFYEFEAERLSTNREVYVP